MSSGGQKTFPDCHAFRQHLCQLLNKRAIYHHVTWAMKMMLISNFLLMNTDMMYTELTKVYWERSLMQHPAIGGSKIA